jgi:TatA/E family protein of Tat protein translocase
MFNIGPGEMMLLALLALLLFGPKRLPEIGKAAGEAIASFRNASKEITGEMSRQLAEENKKAEALETLPTPSLEVPPVEEKTAELAETPAAAEVTEEPAAPAPEPAPAA